MLLQVAERGLEVKMFRNEITDLRRLLDQSQTLLRKDTGRHDEYSATVPARSLLGLSNRSQKPIDAGDYDLYLNG